MSTVSVKQFSVFFDRYYWQTAVLIAKNGLARQYRNSFLGMMWTLFQPLTMVFVYATIMPMIMRSSAPNYRLYIITSLPLWAFFSGALFGSSLSIISNGETLKRCTLSSTIFPIADVLRQSYTFFISFFTMYIVWMVISGTFSLMFLWVPVFFIPIVMTIGAVAVAIAFLAPYVRDIGDFVLVCMNMLFWLTPVIYTIDSLPPLAQFWMQFNPFYIMMHPIQMLAYEHVLPGPNEIFKLLMLTLIAIIFGFSIFKICRRNYVYYL